MNELESELKELKRMVLRKCAICRDKNADYALATCFHLGMYSSFDIPHDSLTSP